MIPGTETCKPTSGHGRYHKRIKHGGHIPYIREFKPKALSMLHS